MALQPGLTGRAAVTVAEEDTAVALRSGEVHVLATPRLIALCEEATCRALDGETSPEQTTIAMRVQFDHLAPSAIGSEVTAEAALEKIEGRRLVFNVAARDARGLVGAGKVTRLVVDTEQFLRRAR